MRGNDSVRGNEFVRLSEFVRLNEFVRRNGFVRRSDSVRGNEFVRRNDFVRTCKTVRSKGITMDYRKYGRTFYIRGDRGDEIIGCILDVCKREHIRSATFSGIGGCSEAQIQTFLPEERAFETQTLSGMLELVSLTGSIVTDERDDLSQHSHAVFSYKEDGRHAVAAGHIKSITVLYTAEIELRPVDGGVISRRFDEETGTGFWSFN